MAGGQRRAAEEGTFGQRSGGQSSQHAVVGVLGLGRALLWMSRLQGTSGGGWRSSEEGSRAGEGCAGLTGPVGRGVGMGQGAGHTGLL